MNATVDLTRARLVEFDTLYKDGTVSLLVSRRQSSNAFTPLGVNGEPPTEDWGIWRTHDIVSSGTNIRILAEFPVTLADLIPEGCTTFRFRDTFGTLQVAWRDGNRWLAGDNGFDDLRELQNLMCVDLNTVIPLQVHSQYIEERR